MCLGTVILFISVKKKLRNNYYSKYIFCEKQPKTTTKLTLSSFLILLS